jgi:hypothetical protein
MMKDLKTTFRTFYGSALAVALPTDPTRRKEESTTLEFALLWAAAALLRERNERMNELGLLRGVLVRHASSVSPSSMALLLTGVSCV